MTFASHQATDYQHESRDNQKTDATIQANSPNHIHYIVFIATNKTLKEAQIPAKVVLEMRLAAQEI